MGHVDLSGVSYALPDGRPLLDEVSFRVGEGAKVALCARGQERLEALAAPFVELSEAAEILVRAHLIDAGYHRRKGEYRRARGEAKST